MATRLTSLVVLFLCLAMTTALIVTTVTAAPILAAIETTATLPSQLPDTYLPLVARALTPTPTQTRVAPTPTSTLTPTATRTPTRTPAHTPTATTPPRAGCDPAYPTVCIPSPPPDLDCSQIAYTNFTVLPPDPHGFDGRDNDGVGCET